MAVGRRNTVAMPCVQEVGYDQPVFGDGPRTLSGKRPTAASLQLQREYLDWSAVTTSSRIMMPSWLEAAAWPRSAAAARRDHAYRDPRASDRKLTDFQNRRARKRRWACSLLHGLWARSGMLPRSCSITIWITPGRGCFLRGTPGGIDVCTG